ncbi:MAG: hypothetical protein ASARMPRED_004599 [Alectoria sarmentosa]|nr:MAG: hypothetical protein ASARMPRED_004599 [Alectoria sarmentosa]
MTEDPNYTENEIWHKLHDLGCCFAQDIRKLARDGAPTENLYACDLEQSFLDLSYDLFQDRDTMKGHFFTANALEEDAVLDKVQGKMDFVYTASFLHLFGWDDQLKTGNVKGQEVRNTSPVGIDPRIIWRHSVESFAKLWDVAGAETGTKWRTWGQLDEAEGMTVGHWAELGIRRLRFEVARME